MDYQHHYGRKFYLDKKKGYWISTTYPRIRAHIWVWKSNDKEIPKGFHIHHKDNDKSNNDIENLEIMSSFDHLSLHASTEINKKRSSELCNKIRPLTKAWHASAEGKEWHRIHGIKTWAERQEIELICQKCGKRFLTKAYAQHFCSNACKSAWRRDMKYDHVIKICPICGKSFDINKYSKTKTCGRKCGKLLQNKIN